MNKVKKNRSEYLKEYYQLNKDKIVKRHNNDGKARRIRYREYVNNYFLTHPCVDCGNNNPIVLQFDHVRGEKRMAVALMSHYSIEEIQKEIDKCEVRCANCHAIVTHNRKQDKLLAFM